jgi:hypothetical protein
MKRRVNLTIDAKLVVQAKTFAHRQGTSISMLVEKGLQNLTRDSDIQGASFADKWAGKLNLAPRDPKDRQREHLWRKYKLAGNANSHRH